LGIALGNGTEPLFVDDPSLDTLLRYDLTTLAATEPKPSVTRSLVQLGISADLI